MGGAFVQAPTGGEQLLRFYYIHRTFAIIIGTNKLKIFAILQSFNERVG